LFIFEKEETFNLHESNIEGFFIPENNYSQIKNDLNAAESTLKATNSSQFIANIPNNNNNNNVKLLLRNKLLSKTIQKEEEKIQIKSKLN
jgi:hypothetical protein